MVVRYAVLILPIKKITLYLYYKLKETNEKST